MGDVTAHLHVDPRAPATLAQQIREQLTWLISSGALQPGDDLPAARGLATELGVNFHTVRGAYLRLEADGLVEARRGRRTRVARFDPRRLWPPESAARTHVVGVVLPTLSNPFYGELLEGAEEAARRSGTLLIVATTHDDQALALQSVAQLAAKGVDGVVVVSHDISALLDGTGDGPTGDRRLPLVVADRPGARGDTVEFDLEAAGYLAARHLVEHGHRRLGLISLVVPASNVAPREAGVRRSLDEAGLALDEGLVVRAKAFDPDAGAAAAARLLGRADPPTAIVAIADLLAIGAIGELRRTGLRVPEDMAIVGMDDIPLARALDPALTTVALPARAMGAEALATLERTWSGNPGPPRRIVLDVGLVPRASCGRHPT
jgi:LacI family transcriptional regulator